MRNARLDGPRPAENGFYRDTPLRTTNGRDALAEETPLEVREGAETLNGPFGVVADGAIGEAGGIVGAAMLRVGGCRSPSRSASARWRRSVR